MNPAAADPDSSGHLPVLYQAVLHWLQPASGRRFLDGTVGGGGHAAGILEAGASLVGLDRDPDALKAAFERLLRFGDRLVLRQESYRRAGAVLRGIGWESVDGILLDLGLSSLQLADPERGMAFRQDGPLDMRFDRSGGETAADLLNTLPVEEIEWILRTYGEESQARRIAAEIVRRRPLTTTLQLAGLAAGVMKHRKGGVRSIHPATRTFQALRIAVNHELEELEASLPGLMDCLGTGGRLAVITFHSLEDRIVKRTFREASGKTWKRGVRRPPYAARTAPLFRDLTPKPVLPDARERDANPRSRSAKLRVVERIAPAGPAAARG